MKVRVKNLGALRDAEFEIGDLTIICGPNNSGKTYAIYALFGFLLRSHRLFVDQILNRTRSKKTVDVDSLIKNGSLRIDISDYLTNIDNVFKKSSELYKDDLPRVFATEEKVFSGSTFSLTVDSSAIAQKARAKSIHKTFKIGHRDILVFDKQKDSLTLNISLVTEKQDVADSGLPHMPVPYLIIDILANIIFEGALPTPFIASTERTGAAIFHKDLNFARNRLVEEMSQLDKDGDLRELLFKEYKDYPIAVKRNVDFTRTLETVAKESGFLMEQHPEILNRFADIIGGTYIISAQNEIYFKPRGVKRKLTIYESSSAVLSLLDVGFHLHHVAKPGDMLMVDEPELNLHPENQRKLARLFSQLVNIGIKVFVATHSDYFVKELNTLIMLHRQDKPHLKRIAEREGYDTQEFLESERVRVYVAEKKSIKDDEGKRINGYTFTQAPIDEQGIEVASFDKTINTMNRIQEEILWGDDE